MTSSFEALKYAVNNVIDAYVTTNMGGKKDTLTVGDIKNMKAEAFRNSAREAFKRQQGRHPTDSELTEFVLRNGPPSEKVPKKKIQHVVTQFEEKNGRTPSAAEIEAGLNDILQEELAQPAELTDAVRQEIADSSVYFDQHEQQIFDGSEGQIVEVTEGNVGEVEMNKFIKKYRKAHNGEYPTPAQLEEFLNTA